MLKKTKENKGLRKLTKKGNKKGKAVEFDVDSFMNILAEDKNKWSGFKK